MKMLYKISWNGKDKTKKWCKLNEVEELDEMLFYAIVGCLKKDRNLVTWIIEEYDFEKNIIITELNVVHGTGI